MKRLFMVFLVAIVLLPWLAGTRVQADAIHWTASGSPLGAGEIESNNFGIGTIGFTPGNITAGTNSGSVVALNVNAGTNPDILQVATFSGSSANYSLSLALHDDASGDSGSLTFRGNLSGDISDKPYLTNTFLGPTTQTLKLGQNQYTVTIGPFVAPENGNTWNFSWTGGSISASISAQPATASTPEPSSLLLACLSLPPFGLARCFRRQRHRKDVDDNAAVS